MNCSIAFIYIAIQQPYGHSPALTWMELERIRPVKCKKKNITINSHYNSDCVSNPIIMFLSQLNCEACNKKRHNVASLSPSGSFPQMILDMKWFGGKKEGKKSIFSRWWWPSTEKRKGNLWNSITQRPGFFYFYFHKQCWPISCMATDSNNCSHTNSIAVDRLAQGVDIDSIFI